MTSYEIVSTIIAVLGLVGGTLGFVRAQMSNRKASSALEEARASAVRSTAAHEASADALRRANELTEAMMPTPSVSWRVHLSGFWEVELHNVGDIDAIDVVVSPIDRRHIVAAEALGFETSNLVYAAQVLTPTEFLRFSGHSFNVESSLIVRFRVEWTESGDTMRKHQTVQSSDMTPPASVVIHLDSSIAPSPAPQTF